MGGAWGGGCTAPAWGAGQGRSSQQSWQSPCAPRAGASACPWPWTAAHSPHSVPSSVT
jgi:hypothetical protein